ncbi:hypothetical protein evm_001651 [Chilo suppressalis]|nr:hypothetical protein evm_001651 [Chilo suppressalis]
MEDQFQTVMAGYSNKEKLGSDNCHWDRLVHTNHINEKWRGSQVLYSIAEGCLLGCGKVVGVPLFKRHKSTLIYYIK